MRRQRVAPAGRIQKDNQLRALAARCDQELVSRLVVERFRVDLVSLGSARPAFLGQHHRHRLAGQHGILRQRLGRQPLHQRRAPRVAIGIGVFLQLLANQGLQAARRRQYPLQPATLCVKALPFLLNGDFFQPCQSTQPQVQNGVRLRFAKVEARHQGGFGIVLVADDLDDLIDVKVDNQQPFQNVQALQHAVQAMLQTAAHRLGAELQPLLQHGPQVLHLRAPVQADHVEIDAIRALQVGGGKQVRHHGVRGTACGRQHDDQASGVFVVRLVAQVHHHRQLLGAQLAGNLLQYLGARNLVRQCRDHDGFSFPLVPRPHAQGAGAGLVHAQDFLARRDDFRFRGKIRRLHELTEFLHRCGGFLQQTDAGFGDLAQVVRRNVRCHPDGNARGSIEKHVRQARRQKEGLVQGAVEVGCPVHRPLADFGQQHVGERCQPRLGVTHGGERLRVIGRAEIALPVDQWVAVGKGLRHQHHGIVAGRFAVRVELADHVADGARSLLGLCLRRQVELRHGVNDAALHRLEAVADVRQGAIEYDVHGVGQVGPFGVRLERKPLHAVVRGQDSGRLLGHGGVVSHHTSARLP